MKSRTAAGEAPALGVIPTHGTEAALEGGGVPGGGRRRQGRRPPRPTAGEAALEGGGVPGHRRAPGLEGVEDAPEERQEAAGRPRGRQGVGVHRHRGPRRQHQLQELARGAAGLRDAQGAAFLPSERGHLHEAHRAAWQIGPGRPSAPAIRRDAATRMPTHP